MSYINVETVLPEALVNEIQKYVDGEYLYIPKLKENCRAWGDETTTKQELIERNEAIFEDYKKGKASKELAKLYFLSVKSIQRILLVQRKKC